MFEGIYIADSKDHLVFEYLAALHAPEFTALLATIRSKQADSVLQNLQLVEINSNYFVCSHATHSLVIYVLCLELPESSTGYNPLVPFVFIERLVDVMHDYFGTPLAPTKITANSDTLTLLVHEMVVDGLSNITDSNKLRELVLLRSLLLKILRTSNQLATAATNKSLASLSKVAAQGNAPVEEMDIPWRKSNVKYTNNEMFLDVVETINVVLRPKRSRKKLENVASVNFDSAFYSSVGLLSGHKLVPVSGTISGKIDFLAHISGVPQLQILLNSAAAYIEAPQLHRCVNLDTWLNSHALSFIPPDGQSTLMTYQVDLDTLPQRTRTSMLGLLQFDCQQDLGVHQNEFEVRILSLKHQAVLRIESIVVQVFAYEPTASTDDDELGSELDNKVSSIKALRVTDGDFRYKGKGVGEWTIKNLATGTQPVLRGTVRAEEGDVSREQSMSPSNSEDLIEVDRKSALFPLYYKVTFSYKGNVPSGLKVDSLKLVAAKGMGDSVKPYKGVKYLTKTGDYNIRLQ